MAFGDFTVTRASSKRVLGPAGTLVTYGNNEPALEFNANGSYRGLSVEPGGTNLSIRSEEFNTWSATRVSVTADNTTAPDGTMTADKLLDSVDANTHFLSRTSTVANATVHTLSIFAKAGEYDFLRLEMGNNGNGAYFNLATGAVVGATTFNPTITPLANGWYRCTVTVTSITTNIAFVVAPSPNGTSINYTGTGTSGIFLWGAQLETGSVATSYIPTAGSTANRSADAITLTGASSLIGATTGWLYAEFEPRVYTAAAGRRIFALSNNTNDERLQLIYSTGGGITQFAVSGGNTQVNETYSSALSGTLKALIRYATDAFFLHVNGLQRNSDLSATVPVNLSRIDIGQGQDGFNQLNGWLKAAVLGTTTLTEAQGNTLTTL